jgi:hypothetical protein
MRWASLRWWLAGGAMMGVVGVALIALSTPPQAHRMKAGPDCESGVLDPGEADLNVLVYRLCPERLTIGFASSDVLEEISCMPNGDVRLWLLAGNARCDRLPASDRDQVQELWEPLTSVGRSTAAPVRQLLLCRAGMMNRATIIVPDARYALLETHTGDTKYEAVTRRLISACVRPNA